MNDVLVVNAAVRADAPRAHVDRSSAFTTFSFVLRIKTRPRTFRLGNFDLRSDNDRQVQRHRCDADCGARVRAHLRSVQVDDEIG